MLGVAVTFDIALSISFLHQVSFTLPLVHNIEHFHFTSGYVSFFECIQK
jgi:hypothetical protein